MAASSIPRINLLPWREARQLRRRQLFLVCIGGAMLLTLLCVAGIYRQLQSAVTEREHDNASLALRIMRLQQLADEQHALSADFLRQQAAFALVRQVHADRIRQSRLLSTLVQPRPPGLAPGELHFEPPAIELAGSAVSARHASRRLQKLEARGAVAAAELLSLNLNPQRQTASQYDYAYRIRLELHGSSAEYLMPGNAL